MFSKNKGNSLFKNIMLNIGSFKDFDIQVIPRKSCLKLRKRIIKIPPQTTTSRASVKENIDTKDPITTEGPLHTPPTNATIRQTNNNETSNHKDSDMCDVIEDKFDEAPSSIPQDDQQDIILVYLTQMKILSLGNLNCLLFSSSPAQPIDSEAT